MNYKTKKNDDKKLSKTKSDAKVFNIHVDCKRITTSKLDISKKQNELSTTIKSIRENSKPKISAKVSMHKPIKAHK